MTQEAVARAAGLHLTYISQLEAGKRNPSWANVKRLADAFGISMRDLAGLAEEMESEQPSLT